jgi:hypothetical protein
MTQARTNNGGIPTATKNPLNRLDVQIQVPDAARQRSPASVATSTAASRTTTPRRTPLSPRRYARRRYGIRAGLGDRTLPGTLDITDWTDFRSLLGESSSWYDFDFDGKTNVREPADHRGSPRHDVRSVARDDAPLTRASQGLKGEGCRRRTRNSQWTDDRIFDHRPLRTART